VTAPTMPIFKTDDSVKAAIESAIDTIAPTWPLDRMIAVNPYWGRISQSFDTAGSTLAKIAGSPMAPPPSLHRDAWQSGKITREHLEQAVREMEATMTVERLVEALDGEGHQLAPPPLLGDTLDSQRDLRHEPAWCDTITHQVAQFCAAYFDQEQADWRPDQAHGLYASWRSALARDHSISLLMKAPWVAAKAGELADHPELQIEQALAQLGVTAGHRTEYLQSVLMRVSGWAAWCAYRRWQARLAGGEDHTMVDLLAIRLSWERLLDDGERQQGSVWSRWQAEWLRHFEAGDEGALQERSIWQRAAEISYQSGLISKLAAAPAGGAAVTPEVQAAFCIDVRSEVFRRHLEAQSPGIQTLGFAGFFGLPISYTPLGTEASRPQLPGLLAPALAITDSAGDSATDSRIVRERDGSMRGVFSWRTFQSVPLSAFTLVETLGLGYLGKLVQRTLPGTAPMASDNTWGLSKSSASALCPVLDRQAAGGVAGQAAIASQVLTGMGLTGSFARLVLLVGHGSQTRNNPHRAGLDCGACCGQTGEVNARALAGLLNDPAVRQQLREDGIDIPDSTCFLAGLHNTTTDEVVLYDLDRVPASHSDEVSAVAARLAAAGQAARRERAPALGLKELQDDAAALSLAVRERANDWAQTRPEWGLADNAVFVVAPRSRTRGVNLEGRSFLHDYDSSRDQDGALLELIMTAPVVVAHWINMQYYASTVDNRRYGSGNKTLHNVVGGRLGVFEGNGGDLRIGLPMQSVHDGERWCHTPLRLTVVIEAPRHAIEKVIAEHATVRQLVENRWLYLMRLEGDTVEWLRDGTWQACAA